MSPQDVQKVSPALGRLGAAAVDGSVLSEPHEEVVREGEKHAVKIQYEKHLLGVTLITDRSACPHDQALQKECE